MENIIIIIVAVAVVGFLIDIDVTKRLDRIIGILEDLQYRS